MRNRDNSETNRRIRRPEWPTWGIVLGVYGGWTALTFLHGALPVWLLAPLGALLTAWHGSLQHETIHGHPTRSRRINALVGWPPLSLWMPYELYRASHLAHHRDERITCPIEDPESFYVLPEEWAAMGRARRGLLLANQTLLGRMILGPAIAIAGFWKAEAATLLRGNVRHWVVWTRHVAGVAAILLWLTAICGFPVWLYLAAFSYGGLSLTLLRSFAEHRAAVDPRHRTAVVEAGPLFGLLFLNNNLHVAHHAKPGAPWYRLPTLSRNLDAHAQAMDGAGLYKGYRDVIARYLLHPVAHPVHPHPRGRPNHGEIIPQPRAAA